MAAPAKMQIAAAVSSLAMRRSGFEIDALGVCDDVEGMSFGTMGRDERVIAGGAPFGFMPVWQGVWRGVATAEAPWLIVASPSAASSRHSISFVRASTGGVGPRAGPRAGLAWIDACSDACSDARRGAWTRSAGAAYGPV